jgi:hypothetical protein
MLDMNTMKLKLQVNVRFVAVERNQAVAAAVGLNSAAVN